VVLLDAKRFPTPVAVKEHLFECFVPATYRRRSNRLRSRSWTVERAQRWLAFLAWELEHRQSAGNGLAWWQIANAAPRTLSAVSVGIVAGLAGALGYPFPIGFGLGFMFALSVGFLVRRWDRSPKGGLIKGLAGGILGGLSGA